MIPTPPPRLTIELVPRTCFFSNLRSNLSKRDWDFLRQTCYARARHTCEICGGRGSSHPVECHEIWEYDEDQRIQRLTGLVALCPSCHKVKHMALARTMGWEHQARQHLCRINGWNQPTALAYVEAAFEVFERRSQVIWKLDISWLEGKGVDIPDILDR